MVFRILFPILVCFLPFLVLTQDTSGVIAKIDKDLINKKKTISNVLTDTGLMYLHSLTPFRAVVRVRTNHYTQFIPIPIYKVLKQNLANG